jgi:hypothetical protein
MRKPVAQGPDVGRGAAHVHDDGIVTLRQEGGAAHAVGRPRGEAVDGELPRLLGGQHGAVVLRDVERRPDLAPDQGLHEASGRPARQVDQTGVQQRRVLPLEQPDPPEVVRAGDGEPGTFLQQDAGGFFLAGWIEGREHGGDGRRRQASLADAPARLPDGRRVEGHDGASVVLVASLDHEDLAPDEAGQILRPVLEGRQRRAGGEPDADGRDRGQVAPLDYGVGEMRGADHDRVDGARAGGH